MICLLFLFLLNPASPPSPPHPLYVKAKSFLSV
jgi:hypothetical protein